MQLPNKVDRNALPAPVRPNLGNIFIAPSHGTEEKLAKVWEDILGVKPIGTTDNFFDLGGDSLLAAQLFVEIENVFGIKLPLSILYQASNIQEQLNILQLVDLAVDWSPLVKVQPEGSNPALFCFPGKGGNPLRFRDLSLRLGKDQPVYMLQSRGLSGTTAPLKRIEDIAADFLKAIQEVEPDGPYSLVGSSGGGYVAYEIAQKLLSQGNQVNLLAFVDTYGPGYPKYLTTNSRAKLLLYRRLQNVSKHVANLRVADMKGKIAYIILYAKYGWRWMLRLPRTTIGMIREMMKMLTQVRLPSELVEVEKANLIAFRGYVPQPYPGKVNLLRASEQPWGIYPDSTLGWGEVGIQDLVIHEVPGHHGSILFEPRVGKLAQILEELMEYD